MRVLLALVSLAGLAGLCGCAVAPLDEAERARIRVVAPVAARFQPELDFRLPPTKVEGAAAGSAGAAVAAGPVCVFLVYTGPGLFFCVATVAAGAAYGAAATPSAEGLDTLHELMRGELGAPDVQQLLVKRFSDHVARLTPHTIDLTASNQGPQSTTDLPNYSHAVTGAGTLVAELAVVSVGTDLGGDRRLQYRIIARMRLVRPSDGVTLLKKSYWVFGLAGPVHEYGFDSARLLRTISDAVDRVARLMVDDAFLLWSDPGGLAEPQAIELLDPVMRERCFFLANDCFVYKRPSRLDTETPTFRWKPFPMAVHYERAPWLRTARNFVYDLRVYGGDDDRIVEGLNATEHILDRPLSPCRRYEWAVRVRFDTDAGPRALKWGLGGAWPALFLTPCPADPRGDPQPSTAKP